jgi:hypothetical protein
MACVISDSRHTPKCTAAYLHRMAHVFSFFPDVHRTAYIKGFFVFLNDKDVHRTAYIKGFFVFLNDQDL